MNIHFEQMYLAFKLCNIFVTNPSLPFPLPNVPLLFAFCQKRTPGKPGVFKKFLFLVTLEDGYGG